MQKFRGFFGRGKEFRLRARKTGSDCAFHYLRGVAFDTDYPVDLSGFCGEAAGFTMPFTLAELAAIKSINCGDNAS